jgi:hypothetical protein
MDLTLLALIKDQLLQFWAVLLSLLGLGLLWLLIVVRKDLRKVKDHIESRIIEDIYAQNMQENKDIHALPEKEKTDPTKELDLLKITNPILYNQMGELALSLKNQRESLASVKEGAISP